MDLIIISSYSKLYHIYILTITILIFTNLHSKNKQIINSIVKISLDLNNIADIMAKPHSVMNICIMAFIWQLIYYLLLPKYL